MCKVSSSSSVTQTPRNLWLPIGTDATLLNGPLIGWSPYVTPNDPKPRIKIVVVMYRKWNTCDSSLKDNEKAINIWRKRKQVLNKIESLTN